MEVESRHDCEVKSLGPVLLDLYSSNAVLGVFEMRKGAILLHLYSRPPFLFWRKTMITSTAACVADKFKTGTCTLLVFFPVYT